MMKKKHWVLIRKNTGLVAAWRDYGDTAWGSPEYTVLGYHEGSYRDALRVAHSLA
jgi:hypothetical protein